MKYAAAFAIGAILWLLAWYGDTVHTVVAIWERSGTYAHGYIILPISGWLIWRRRHDLARLEPRPNFLVLPLLALLGFFWLVGRLAGAGVVQQYALVLMIPLVVWAVLGTEVVRALAFPLFFLLFAVPFGDFLVPPLMQYTADFTVFALRLSGVPVFREGNFFTVPSGSWSVVEACSGLRYLIASLTLGFLYAYLTYRSFARRATFVAFSVVVPIIANWLRAYMIVMIGHLSNMKYAVGVDHLLYGWVFFGLVMLLLFWGGSFWREDLERERRQSAPGAVPGAHRNPPRLAAIAAGTVAAALVVAVWPVAATRLQLANPSAPALEAPAPAGGWQALAAPATAWAPHFLQPSALVHRVYAKDAMSAGLYVGYYRNPGKDASLISSQNVLISDEQRDWRSIGEAPRTLKFNDLDVPAIEAKLRGRTASLLVWYWYWVDGHYTVNPYWAKLLQAKSSLLGRGDDGAVVMIYAPYGERPQDAARILQEFGGAMLPSISRSLEHARRVQPGA